MRRLNLRLRDTLQREWVQECETHAHLCHLSSERVWASLRHHADAGAQCGSETARWVPRALPLTVCHWALYYFHSFDKRSNTFPLSLGSKYQYRNDENWRQKDWQTVCLTSGSSKFCQCLWKTTAYSTKVNCVVEKGRGTWQGSPECPRRDVPGSPEVTSQTPCSGVPTMCMYLLKSWIRKWNMIFAEPFTWQSKQTVSPWCGCLWERCLVLTLKLLRDHGIRWMNRKPNLLVASMTDQDLGRWGGERGSMEVYDTYQVWFCRRL